MLNLFQIFCTPTPEKFEWKKINVALPYEDQMTHAVKGGFQSNLNENLFIGKVIHEGRCKTGKIIPMPHALKGLWIWNTDGTSLRLDEFYILKYNATA